MDEPTIADVMAARVRIAPHLAPTPAVPCPGLSDVLGARVYLKLESLQPTGAFKVRGGVNLLACEQAALRAAGTGVACASTGNHGQSVAYAGRLFELAVTVFAPRDANPLKVAAMRRLGAAVTLTGADFDASRLACESWAASTGARYIHSMNEPLLIAGVGTAALEVLWDVPHADWLLVPVGGGTGAAGACLAAGAVAPGCRVVGVQAEGAPAVSRSFRERRLLETAAADTMAEGLQTRVAFELPLRIMWERLHAVRLVSDADLWQAMGLLLTHAHLVVEAAGAAPLAAALRMPELRGTTVVLILSGGNATAGQVQRAAALAAEAP